MNVKVRYGDDTFSLPTHDIGGVYVECYESDRWAIRYVCRDGTIFDSIQTVSSHERASIILRCVVGNVWY